MSSDLIIRIFRERGRMLVRVILLFVLPVVAGLIALQWYAANARYVTTDNAYIKTDIITVSPSINGRVTAVHIDDNQWVAKGDVLFELDARPHEIEANRAKARMHSIENEILSMRAQYAQIKAEITDADERVKYFKRQRQRQEDLGAQGMATEAAMDDAEYQVIQATQSLHAVEQKAQQQLAELSGDLDSPVEEHPKFLEAMSAMNEAALAIEYTAVRAPSSGTISRMRLQPGEWVEAGEPVFSLLEAGDLWIEANLKETQLTHVREGQSVTFSVDAYPDTDFNGKIASISGATGAEFLILPPQNATGNWVKVVQRIPVRIEIAETSSVNDQPLRSGMTVKISVDTEIEHAMFGLFGEATASD